MTNVILQYNLFSKGQKVRFAGAMHSGDISDLARLYS